MHAQAGAGVDLADGAAGFAIAAGDVGGEEIPTALISRPMARSRVPAISLLSGWMVSVTSTRHCRQSGRYWRSCR